mgnify:FL=1
MVWTPKAVIAVLDLAKVVLHLNFSLTVDIGISMGMTFPSAPMSILHSRDALELVVELVCHFQNAVYANEMEIQLWGDHQVWSAVVFCWWSLSILFCCVNCVNVLVFLSRLVLALLWLFQPMIAAAHGLPWVVFNLSQALVPRFICWKQCFLSQVVKISRVSTRLILDQVCLCWRLSYVWIIL